VARFESRGKLNVKNRPQFSLYFGFSIQKLPVWSHRNQAVISNALPRWKKLWKNPGVCFHVHSKKFLPILHAASFVGGLFLS